MKYLVVSCILFFCTLQTFGQQEYFIYLQTENSQPFYIRISNNVYSSSSGGYLILSKLADSTSPVTIGFPKNVFPEQQFNIPVNHKDAGYVLKSFGDRGWGLFNLQTLSVIMNSNPPEEKKNPEINGTRKTDAFSLLMANAVNDTAVLYTVNRPPKPKPAAPPAIAVTEEKKKDSLLLVKKDLPGNDSADLVKELPEKKDSSITAKNTRHQKDSATIPKTHLPKPDPTLASAKNGKPVHDTTNIAKNKVAAHDEGLKKNTGSRAQKKDTMIVARNTHLPAIKKQSTAIAKNKKERKDTIIIMNGNKPVNNQAVAKNTTVKKERIPSAQPGKDSLQLIKKEILQAPEEKRGALLNNKDAVVVAKVPVKQDSMVNNAGSKKDTIEILTKNEPVKPPETITDTTAGIPARRVRPLVTKAAELFTDTSYIAVFVDESKEKFDTIRISIPFNEVAAFARQQPAVIKKDTGAAVKNNPAGITQENIPPVVRTDSVVAGKKIQDSGLALAPQAPPRVIKKDSLAGNNVTKDSLPPMDNRETVTAVKKDSLPVPTDAGRDTKAPAQPLFLNSDCKEIAFDSDIDKLRIKMLVVVSDEDRIGLAKRLFKQKCMLVKQVKALSELFKTDDGKYKWFDAAYSYVSDTGNFSSLGELIKDDYYLNRFKAMLRH